MTIPIANYKSLREFMTNRTYPYPALPCPALPCPASYSWSHRGLQAPSPCIANPSVLELPATVDRGELWAPSLQIGAHTHAHSLPSFTMMTAVCAVWGGREGGAVNKAQQCLLGEVDRQACRINRCVLEIRQHGVDRNTRSFRTASMRPTGGRIIKLVFVLSWSLRSLTHHHG
ncbi:hypothetical protein CC78DRAFT_573148 [Lojkania enalia]|uniref:Uncharacterized protein n=1 Tax=Lojkania enalia TaxID=147567 RepID=A0A9P4NCN4_9PLEO|nr:hypothetical protein CC78DRAFT_573148 [Didymosphaeria enalia]